MPVLDGLNSSILRPPIEANSFELKPVMFQMLQTVGQFNGLPAEDSHTHLLNFLAICDSYKQNGVSDEAVRLRLFPFSLSGNARLWLNSLEPNLITNWNELAQNFLMKYFSPAKTAKFRNEITSFVQNENESLHDDWERFKELLQKCPHHGMPNWIQIQSFYN